MCVSSSSHELLTEKVLTSEENALEELDFVSLSKAVLWWAQREQVYVHSFKEAAVSAVAEHRGDVGFLQRGHWAPLRQLSCRDCPPEQ